MGDQVTTKEPTSAEIREAMIWKVLRAAYLRVEARHLGKLPITLMASEAEAILDRWHRAMERDVEMLREVILNAQQDGASEAYGRMHSTSVSEHASHELLDEALEATETPTVEAPYMVPPRLQYEGGSDD